jgi:hypothetical protein
MSIRSTSELLANTLSTVPNSAITGDIAVSPIASDALTGFSLTLDASTQFSTSTQITGKAFPPDYAVPTPGDLTQAVYDMEAAYTNAAARSNTDASRKILEAAPWAAKFFPGVYTFTSGVSITSGITFEGGPDDIFIIQIAGTFTQAANTHVYLAGCAQAKNIIWQVKTFATIGADASMQGILLVFERVDFITGSSLVGSALAQTAANLQKATITQATDTCSVA